MRESFNKKLNIIMATCIDNEESRKLKETVLDAMCKKYDECIGYGYDKRTAYVIALKEIKHYYREIWTFRKELIKSLKWEKLWKLLAVTATYFIGVVLIYLIISFAIPHSWGWTWSIIVGASFAYLIGLLIFCFSYLRARDKFYLAGVTIWGATYLSVCGIYLLISFLTHLWAYTWIMFIAAFAIAYILNLFYLWHQEIRKPNKLDITLVSLSICITIYFFVSFMWKAFNVTWLIFVGFVFLLFLFVTIDLLSKKKDDDEDSNSSDSENNLEEKQENKADSSDNKQDNEPEHTDFNKDVEE